MIPEAAVEAAAKCGYERELGVNWDNLRPSVQRGYLDDARAALEAAAPHMRQAFFLEMNLRAVKEELNTPFRKATYGDDMR